MAVSTRIEELAIRPDPEADFEFLPAKAYDLIDWLDSKNPPREIGLGESLEVAHRRAGKRELIDYLIHLRSQEIELAQSVDRGAIIRRGR